MRAAKLAFVWLWVAIPLGWGVMKSIRKALPLFEAASDSRDGNRRESQAPPESKR